MMMRSNSTRRSRWVLILLMSCCWTMSLGAGCDVDVQTALVTGLNSALNTAATTLINAAFLTITPDQTSSGGSQLPDDEPTV